MYAAPVPGFVAGTRGRLNLNIRLHASLICFFDGTVALRDVRACFKENSSPYISIPKAGLSLLKDLFYKKMTFL